MSSLYRFPRVGGYNGARMGHVQHYYQIALPIFEGPMDLLLHLIRENKLDIYDIPIAHITRQYLETLELMKELNLEVAGEFLVVAATLIQIKSRMLLPPDETGDGEAVDPRKELVERLLEYERFREATPQLREREELWRQVFSRPGVEDLREIPAEPVEEDPVLFDVGLFDLLSSFRALLEKVPAEMVEITRETLTVKDRIAHILDTMERRENIRFEDLFSGVLSRRQLIVTFLALLEVLRLGLLRVYQERHMTAIWVITARQPLE